MKAVSKSDTVNHLVNNWNTMSQAELKRVFEEWRDELIAAGVGDDE